MIEPYSGAIFVSMIFADIFTYSYACLAALVTSLPRLAAIGRHVSAGSQRRCAILGAADFQNLNDLIGSYEAADATHPFPFNRCSLARPARRRAVGAFALKTANGCCR
jgi:hypothetical protein